MGFAVLLKGLLHVLDILVQASGYILECGLGAFVQLLLPGLEDLLAFCRHLSLESLQLLSQGLLMCLLEFIDRLFMAFLQFIHRILMTVFQFLHRILMADLHFGHSPLVAVAHQSHSIILILSHMIESDHENHRNRRQQHQGRYNKKSTVHSGTNITNSWHIS